MSLKLENEITVRITVSNEELIKLLEEKGFKEKGKFSLDDYYFIPEKLDIDSLSTREIISKAVIIRDIFHEKDITKKITFKIKDIDEKGEILNQKAINCSIFSIDEAKELFKAIGYYEIMNIKEDDVVYSKGDIALAIKFIKNGNTLIEIETDENYDTIEKLKKIVKDINLPIEENEYFVKKAEDELNKILKRG